MSSLSAPSRAHAPAQPSPLAVGTVVWLASELMFFSGLFAAWFTLKSAAPQWPPPGVSLDVAVAGFFTLVLVGSSVTMQLAQRRIVVGDAAGMRRWLAITGLLGVLFLVNQAHEFATLGFGVGSHAYGSAFYLLVGFHALHVAAGVVMMVFVLGRSAAPSFGAGDAPSVEVVSYYWHFVDVVWLAVYAVVFLLG